MSRARFSARACRFCANRENCIMSKAKAGASHQLCFVEPALDTMPEKERQFYEAARQKEITEGYGIGAQKKQEPKSGQYIEYGANYARHRQLIGISQRELAKILGCGQDCISTWERGIRLPEITYRKKMAALFNCELAELGPPEEMPAQKELQDNSGQESTRHRKKKIAKLDRLEFTVKMARERGTDYAGFMTTTTREERDKLWNAYLNSTT